MGEGDFRKKFRELIRRKNELFNFYFRAFVLSFSSTHAHILLFSASARKQTEVVVLLTIFSSSARKGGGGLEVGTDGRKNPVVLAPPFSLVKNMVT